MDHVALQKEAGRCHFVSPALTRTLHTVGAVLGILGVIFVGERLYHYSGEIDLDRISKTGWWLLGILSVVYGAANILLALAWSDLLRYFKLNVKLGWAIRVYGLSQLAKYVPGNIFQFAGRQALGMAVGYAGRPLAKSAIWEIGLIATTGCLFSALTLPLLYPSWNALFAMGVFVIFVCGVGYTLWRYFSSSLTRVFIWHTLFLVTSGLVFVGTLQLISPEALEFKLLPAVCGAYVLAWLAGLITPGAPAGLGVREAVTLFLLSSIVSPGDLLLAIVLSRIITLLGDLMFFAANTFSYLDKN